METNDKEKKKEDSHSKIKGNKYKNGKNKFKSVPLFTHTLRLS